MQCRDDVQKTRCLRDLEAFSIEWLRLLGNTHKEQHNIQGMYTSNVECRCQHCKNPSGDKKKSDEVTMEPIKHNSNERGNEAKKYMQHNSKQSNRKGKITNQVRLTVLVLRSPEGNIRKQEGKEQLSAIIVAAMIIKGKAAHSVHSMYRQVKCLITLVCV